MNFGKKIVVAVSLEETSHSQLAELHKLEFLKNAEVHFVHVYQTTNMGYGLGEFSLVYPVEPDRGSLEKALREALIKSCQGCISGSQVIYQCLFDANPKAKFCLYAEEVKADTVIIFTRERHGLFESSFAQYAARHSKGHTLILKT